MSNLSLKEPTIETIEQTAAALDRSTKLASTATAAYGSNLGGLQGLALFQKSMTVPAIALVFIHLFASGCATPVGVTRLDEQAAHRELIANVLSVGKPSAYSTQLLERTALSEPFTQDPQAVLAELNSGLGEVLQL